jgi:long-chain acyl-CoA synthetase
MKNKIPKKEQERFDRFYKEILINGTIFYAGMLLQRAAERFGQNTALICQREKITYAALYQWACNITHLLTQRGSKAGDRVCLLFENSIQFYVAYYGIWQTGAVVVPLNTFLHETELTHILTDAKPSALIVSAIWQEKLKKINSALPPLISEEEINRLRTQAAAKITIPSVDADELAALLYTSGTTGVPKGVMLSSRNILTNVVQAMSRIDVSTNDSIFAALPLFHSFAQLCCVWGSFFLGGTAIVVPKIERKLLLQGLQYKPTIMMGVPALYGLFCLMKNAPFPAVRYFVTGGDAMPDKIRSSFEIIYRRRICNGFGLTETSPLVAANLDDELLPANTVGRPSIGMECQIRTENGDAVDARVDGVLWVKGDNVMLGYYNAPEQTAQVLQDGWFNTGDRAYFDDEGRLVITGREKDLIIHKGFNIYPQEIENILSMHPAVMRVGVVGKEDVDVGQVPVAFVSLREKGSETIEVELMKLCKQHLASYKIPKQIIILEEMPVTSLSKVDKKRLRKEYL